MPDNTSEEELEKIPARLTRNTTIRGKTWVAGTGPKPADIMFVSPVISFEEAEDKKRIGYDKYIDRTPRYTDSGSWQIVKAIALEHGIDISNAYVTAIVKYLPDNKSHQTKPTVAMMNECMAIFEDEVRRVKPKIIVCLGKVAFDVLHDEKLAADDIYGAWFDSRQYKCRLYPMLHISQALKPEKSERWHLDFANVARELQAMNGITTEEIPLNYMVIHNARELEALTMYLEAINATVLSIDGEFYMSSFVA